MAQFARTLTIVGVGLIGGSIGLAARQRGLVKHIIGVGRRWESLALAQQCGALDNGTLDLREGVAAADLVVFCTPVDRIAKQILEVAPHCQPGTLITDAGSTKANITSVLEGQLPESIAFVGSHPLAGSEKQGPQAARVDLFEGKLVVVTPTAATSAASLQRVSAFWRALGAEVRFLDPVEHDRTLAVTSHLPHLLAASLSRTLPPDWQAFTATGFRDTTRLAAGDPEVWTAIFRANRPAILDAIHALQHRLKEFHAALTADDPQRISQLLFQAKQVRDALGSGNPPPPSGS